MIKTEQLQRKIEQAHIYNKYINYIYQNIYNIPGF